MDDLTSYKDKTVLVTGANGLLGAHVVKILVDLGAKVHALTLDINRDSFYVRDLDHSRFREYTVDLNDPLGLQRIFTQVQPQVVLHLGAETQVKTGYLNPYLTYSTNFLGTLHILEIARKYLTSLESIVVASSDKAYGEADQLPYTEKTQLKAHGPYDTSKACMDLMCQSYGQTYDLPITILRAGNIYGPGDLNWDRIIPGVVRWLIKNETPVLRSSGEMIRDYIYVEDVARAYLIAGLKNEHQKLEVFNVSSNSPINVSDLYAKLCDLVAGKYISPIKKLSSTPEIREQRLDSTLINSKRGWVPQVRFEQGILLTIDWYKKLLNE